MSTATLAPVEQTDSPTTAAELGARISELCSYVYAAESRLLNLIREFDQNEYWAELGLCSCAHWLNLKCGISMGAAREKVRVAHALADLPRISAGFANGTLSYSKVRAMTRIADASNEDYLLMIARHGTAHHVEKLVSKYRRAKRLEDDEIANQQRHHRNVTHYYDDDGSLVIKARLPAEQGALFVKALEMAMDEAFEHQDADDEPESVGVRRADALADIAETYLNNSESSGSTADRYQVVVHIGPDGEADLADGPHVSAGTSRRIACDSSIVMIREDKYGEPLSIGRRTRSIPPAMRRALGMRDGGCRFPGCTHTKFVDGHHIRHWANGGETSLDNLVTLCRHHHHLVHEGGFVCEQDADGKVTFKDRNQQPLDDTGLQPGIAAHDDVQHWIDREFFALDIDSESPAARWYAGERMDWNQAVGGLFSSR